MTTDQKPISEWEEHLRALADRCGDERVDSAIQDWRDYFTRLGIAGEEKQTEEFQAVVRARLVSGVVSFAAPGFGFDVW